MKDDDLDRLLRAIADEHHSDPEWQRHVWRRINAARPSWWRRVLAWFNVRR